MALITKVPGLIVDETSNFTFANANVTGNLTSGNANLGNLATANYVAGTLITALQPNITQVGSLANLTVTGNITAGAVKTNSLLYANGEAYAIGGGITIAGTNSQVQFNSTGSFGASANFTFNTSTNTLSVDKIAADGGLLSNIAAANVSGTVANATYATTAGTATSATTATTAGTVTTNAQPNITSVGTLSGLTVNGNIAVTNADLGNAVTANYFIGSGANLSNLQASNVTGTVANATFATTAGTATSATTATTATSATTAGTVTTAAQPNITSLGTLTSVTVTGNVTADYFIGSGNNLSNLQASNVTGTVANATYAISAGTATSATSATTAATVTTNAQPNITSVGTLSSLTVNGDITSTNANLGNAATANYFIGSGANLSNIQASNVTGTVANATFATTAGTATSATSATTAGTVTTNAQPNITSTGTLSGLTVNGDITSNNVIVNASTASTSKTTGALTVAGGVGINNDLTVGNSITVDGGSYGNVVVTQFGSVFARGSGPNPRAIYQATAADGTAGLGMQAYSGLNGQIYSNTGFTFTTGATVRDKDFPTGGTTRATIDSTGLIVTGIANISGNISALNANLGNAATANYFIGDGSLLTNLPATTAATVTANAQPNITSTGTLVNLEVSGNVAFTGANVSLGSVSNLHIDGGTSNYFLKTDGTGNLSWTSVPTATIVTDAFTGNGVQTAFTLSVTPDDKQYTTVNLNGATLLKTSYSLTGAVLTLNEAPDSTSDIEVTTFSNNITFSTIESGLSAAAKARITGYNLIFGG